MPQLIRALFLLAALVPAGAGALEESDRAATRSAIEGQIDAFRRDDAAAAYAFASPVIQRMFLSEDRFLDMVREGYRPVYRPRSYDFGPLRETATGLEQAVSIQDADGVDWDAVYSLERQPDGAWRISGCRLVKRPGDNV